MKNETNTGHVLANGLELGRSIMSSLESDHVRAPKNLSKEDLDEQFAARVVSNISKRAEA